MWNGSLHLRPKPYKHTAINIEQQNISLSLSIYIYLFICIYIYISIYINYYLATRAIPNLCEFGAPATFCDAARRCNCCFLGSATLLQRSRTRFRLLQDDTSTCPAALRPWFSNNSPSIVAVFEKSSLALDLKPWRSIWLHQHFIWFHVLHSGSAGAPVGSAGAPFGFGGAPFGSAGSLFDSAVLHLDPWRSNQLRWRSIWLRG